MTDSHEEELVKMGDVIGMSDAAQIAHVSRQTISRAARLGTLKSVPFGTRSRGTTRQWLQEWIDNEKLHKPGVKKKNSV